MGDNIIDGYRKIEGNYPTYREYLIHFYCKDCSNFWAVDDKEINIVEDDDLTNIDDIIDDSVSNCPICGSTNIARSNKNN
ncbi:hypothetical protein R4L22_01220 [Brachyspira pilosicoli]|uniref:hypothetical protein n=1 Tax=Brachyspira pilosicoli TaxID=52584 RepID=UPI0012F4DD73|nr:hypothetical protein [Brachyspira pilosicoli]